MSKFKPVIDYNLYPGGTVSESFVQNGFGFSIMEEQQHGMNKYFSSNEIMVEEALKGKGVGKRLLASNVKNILKAQKNSTEPFKIGPMALSTLHSGKGIKDVLTSDDALRMWDSKGLNRLFSKWGLEKRTIANPESGREYSYFASKAKAIEQIRHRDRLPTYSDQLESMYKSGDTYPMIDVNPKEEMTVFKSFSSQSQHGNKYNKPVEGQTHFALTEGDVKLWKDGLSGSGHNYDSVFKMNIQPGEDAHVRMDNLFPGNGRSGASELVANMENARISNVQRISGPSNYVPEMLKRHLGHAEEGIVHAERLVKSNKFGRAVAGALAASVKR